MGFYLRKSNGSFTTDEICTLIQQAKTHIRYKIRGAYTLEMDASLFIEGADGILTAHDNTAIKNATIAQPDGRARYITGNVFALQAGTDKGAVVFSMDLKRANRLYIEASYPAIEDCLRCHLKETAIKATYASRLMAVFGVAVKPAVGVARFDTTKGWPHQFRLFPKKNTPSSGPVSHF